MIKAIMKYLMMLLCVLFVASCGDSIVTVDKGPLIYTLDLENEVCVVRNYWYIGQASISLEDCKRLIEKYGSKKEKENE